MVAIASGDVMTHISSPFRMKVEQSLVSLKEVIFFKDTYGLHIPIAVQQNRQYLSLASKTLSSAPSPSRPK